MYWPQIGRFISVDPAGIHPGSPQSWNRYAYVWNNPYRYVDPDGKDVTIAIQRDRYTPVAVSGKITVSSTVAGAGTFNGFTVETARAGPKGDKNPIAPGTYNAFVRTDHDPNRIELKNVPGFKNVQVHVGNTVDDVIGCFAVGQSREWTLYPEVDANGEVPGTYEVQKSTAAMAEINDIVKKDGTGKIKVEVTGSSSPPPQNSPP
jgi:hypothetical protein